ncbi:DNAase [Vibrio sp. EA2]|uniref:DNAase n=1 Tax=Vibrio sp. EA2 TaxID=3079860 RepID=UPI00294A94D6|nr:DNAase [Vibrio sp. EA2]MDV6251068.1 DNAase [Vibrio sp. EA2]
MEKEVVEVVTKSARALGELKPAFRAVPDGEYQELCQAVKEGRVSIYRFKGENHHLVVAGEREGDHYYIWAAAGRGLVAGSRHLFKTAKEAGIKTMEAETAFGGVARMLQTLNVANKPKGEFIQLDLGAL